MTTKLLVSTLLVLWTSAAFAHDGLPLEIREVSATIRENPTDSDALLRRADLYRIERQWVLARADLRAAANAGAPVASTALARGRLELEAGQFAVAERAFDVHLAAGSTFLGHWHRARARRALGRTDEALSDYDHAVTLDKAVDVFRERGALLLDAGRAAEAASNFEMALSRLGEVDLLRTDLFHARLAAGRADAAIAAIAPVMARATIRTRWLLLRARAHDAAGRPADATADRAAALRDADRALQKRRSPLLLVDRAQARLASGDRTGARADALEAMGRAPQYAPAASLFLEIERGGVR